MDNADKYLKSEQHIEKIPSEYLAPSKDSYLRVYHLSPRDMDAVIEAISEIVEERTAQINQVEERLTEEGSENVEDIMDDLRPHNFWKHNFFWESCIWRLQGIFEGILDERFLKHDRDYKGLRDRVSALKKKGFTILLEDELFRWAAFRNQLSHSPPKQIEGHGAQIGRDIAVNFRHFLVEILRDLEKQILTNNLIPN